MLNIRDLYIQGDYIDTPLGKCYFIKVEEYPDMIYYRRFFEIQKDKIVLEAKKDNSDYADILNEMELVQIIKHDSKFRDMFNDFFMFFFKDGYTEVETKDKDGKVIKVKKPDDFMSQIKSDEELESVLDLFKEMNCIRIEKENPNPELAAMDKLKQKMEEAKGEGITYEAMYTSIWVQTGINPENMTVYQFHKLFDRISQFKKYDTSTLFATVASEKSKHKIESWYKDNTDKENESQDKEISEERYKKMIGGKADISNI